MTDWEWVLHNPEGQFLERKSCYDRSGERVRRRDVRSVARDIAETLSAMANADGGTVAVGVENDGTPTGVDYPEDRLNVLREAPKNLVRPPLRARIETPSVQGVRLLVFEVDWSPEAHQLADGRYLLRVGDHNQPFPAGQIEALKAGKRRRIAEVRIVPEASLTDLDPGLLQRVREHTGLALSDADLLLRYRLAESRNGRLLLTLAALLLLGRDAGRWHPRCGIDFVKYEGTERRYGADLNVVKREWIEAPLITLIERAFETIRPHIRERQRLVDLFFEEWLEYPTFAWQEAIINAVAHRDYGFEGVGIEVWMFDDRLEVRSPGQLVEPVTLERLQKRERVHASRNPRIVRLLTDLGHMRELGGGPPSKERGARVSHYRAFRTSAVANPRRVRQDRARFAAEGVRAKQRHPRDIWSFPATSLASAPEVGSTRRTQDGGERAERSLCTARNASLLLRNASSSTRRDAL